MALQELAQNNPDDVTVMSSEFSQAWNVNFFFLIESLRYKLEVWCLKDVDVYQVNQIKDVT